jgi:hypothetical protein
MAHQTTTTALALATNPHVTRLTLTLTTNIL